MKLLNQASASNTVHPYDFLLDCEPPSEDNNYSITRAVGVVTKETWTSVATTNTIKTIDYSRSGGVVTTEVVKVYAPDGIAVVAQKTVTYARSGGQVVSATITRDV